MLIELHIFTITCRIQYFHERARKNIVCLFSHSIRLSGAR